MKHIDKYNKFIKLNEDNDNDINEYDLNIIKDSLIELEDLGWIINKIKKQDDIYIKINLFKPIKIAKDIKCEYKFNKIKIYNRKQELINGREIYPYTLTEYEKYIFNIIKECSLFLINILDYDKGYICIEQDFWNCTVHITLSKNKTE